jgi:hypothetical protein
MKKRENSMICFEVQECDEEIHFDEHQLQVFEALKIFFLKCDECDEDEEVIHKLLI